MGAPRARRRARRVRRRRAARTRPTTATPARTRSATSRRRPAACELPTLERARTRLGPAARGRPRRGRPGPARPPAPARPRQGLDDRPLGADGRRRADARRRPTRTASRRRSSREIERIAAAASLCNAPTDGLAAIETFGEQRARRGRADRLHLAGLGPADRRARGRRAARASCTRSAHRVRELMQGEHAVGRVIARPFDGRAAARLRAHAAPPRLRARAAVALPPRRAAGRARPGPRRRQGRAAVRRRRGSTASHPGATNARGDRVHDCAARASSRQRLRLHEPDRDRPGLRPPQGRRGLPRGAARDRRGGRHVARRCCARTTCWSSPPTTAATRCTRAPTTRASTRRCWRGSPAMAAAATTARSPTSARACCAGSPAATRPTCRGRSFVS